MYKITSINNLFKKDNINNYLKIGIKFNINKEYIVNNTYRKPVLYKMNDSTLIYKIDTYYIKLDPYSYYIKEVNNTE